MTANTTEAGSAPITFRAVRTSYFGVESNFLFCNAPAVDYRESWIPGDEVLQRHLVVTYERMHECAG